MCARIFLKCLKTFSLWMCINVEVCEKRRAYVNEKCKKFMFAFDVEIRVVFIKILQFKQIRKRKVHFVEYRHVILSLCILVDENDVASSRRGTNLSCRTCDELLNWDLLHRSRCHDNRTKVIDFYAFSNACFRDLRAIENVLRCCFEVWKFNRVRNVSDPWW